MNKILKAGAMVALAFFASCQPSNRNEDTEVLKAVIIGTDTVYLNKYGQVIPKHECSNF